MCAAVFTVCFASGAFARLALLSSEYSTSLADDYELSTPATSAPCRREGHFLLMHGHDPLSAGGACAPNPPLLLTTLAALNDSTQLYVLLGADLLCAALLLSAAPVRIAGALAAGAYLLTPWPIAACAAGSSAMLPGLAVLAASHLAGRGWAVAASAALGCGGMLNPDAAWLLFALTALTMPPASASRRVPSSIEAATALVRCGSAYALTVCAGIALLAPRFGGVSHLVRRTLGAWLDAEPVLFTTPNVGLWWYWMVQAFLPIRPTFVLALHTLPRLCVPCLALRLPCHRRSASPPPPSAAQSAAQTVASASGAPPHQLPTMLCMALSHGVLTATKLAPTMPEIMLALAFVASQIDGRLLDATGRLLPIACLAIGNAALAVRPLLSRWLDAREINANFFYAATVALASGQLLLVYELAAAAMQAEADEDAARGVARVQRVWRRRAAEKLKGG